MSKFFRYTRTSGAEQETVFLNLSDISVAAYNNATGNISIQLGEGHRETLIGDHAEALRKVLDSLVAKSSG